MDLSGTSAGDLSDTILQAVDEIRQFGFGLKTRSQIFA
jgi:hypothetical protein